MGHGWDGTRDLLWDVMSINDNVNELPCRGVICCLCVFVNKLPFRQLSVSDLSYIRCIGIIIQYLTLKLQQTTI